MIVLKVTSFLLVILAVGAEKKIELQDIEEDNLRSENEKDHDKSDSEQTGPGSEHGLVPLEFLKSGLFRFFENPTQAPPQQRYLHQYAVTEPPERPVPIVQPKPQYTSLGAQQAMVGYLSNVPMQIYFVPQYYSGQSDQSNTQPGPPYQTSAVARVNGYQSSSPEAVQTQTKYIEVPSYAQPSALSGKAYVQQYNQPVTYVFPTQPTIQAHQPTISPVVAYQTPVLQYQHTAASPTTAPKVYYQSQQYEKNTVDEEPQHEEEKKHYTTQEIPYHKPISPDYPRYYNSRAPIRDEYRHNLISELPPPNPLILKSHPHAHLPKSLPMYRPLTNPVYQSGGGIVSSSFTHRPHEAYGPPLPFKRRPTSLLDSYIPSSVQIEYLKRGLIKEPLAVYDALASGRLPHPIPRHYERGFLPNQMYHTGAGGVTYGHYKRTPQIDNKASHN